MTRLWPNLRGMAQVVQPETILRWHRAGFKVFWRWKSRNRVGRPKTDRGLRDLIQRMSKENPLWGAPRCLALRWPNRRSQDTWYVVGIRPRSPERRFFEIPTRRLLLLICARPPIRRCG